MNYRVDAIFKDRAGKELLRRTPIWTGEADDAKGAIVQAHEPVTAVCKTDERIDSISLTVKGQDGSVIHTTEYAEDFTIGYGASALDGSGLAADGVAPELTDEQREEALKHLKARAVQALPGSAQEKLRQRALEEADPVKDFFGGELPSERASGEGVSVPVDDPFRRGSGAPSGAGSGTPSDLASPGPGCDKTFADCKNKWDNEERFGGVIDPNTGLPGKCPWKFRGSDCGVGGSTRASSHGSTTGAAQGAGAPKDTRDAERGRELLARISDSAQRVQQTTGRRASGVVVNKRDARDMARALGLPTGATVDGGTYKGLDVTVDDGCGHNPQIVMGDSTGTYKPASSKVPPTGGFAQGGVIQKSGTIYIAPLGDDGKPSGPFREAGKVKEFNVTIENDPVHRSARQAMRDYLRPARERGVPSIKDVMEGRFKQP